VNEPMPEGDLREMDPLSAPARTDESACEGEAVLSHRLEKIIRHLALHVLPFPSSCYASRSSKKTYSAFPSINSPEVPHSL
jgi:hypothetical protein